MVAFEVLVNGTHIATAGVGDLGVLLAIVRWVRRPTDRCTLLHETLCDVEVCGNSLPLKDHLVWADRALSVGDEVLVRIIEAETVDEASSNKPIGELPTLR